MHLNKVPDDRWRKLKCRGGGERWDVLIANQWSLIYQPHGYIQKASACVKFWRRWSSPTIFWSHWNAKACRYRFVLMGANTRGDTPVVSLIAFNDSIRVLSPLCHLLSVQIWNHNPHRNIDCRHPALLIINYQFFGSHLLNIFLKLVSVNPRTSCSSDLRPSSEKQPCRMAVSCSALMHYFLLVIFYTGTHLVTSTRLLCFPEGTVWFTVCVAWPFWKGESLAFGKSYGNDEVLACFSCSRMFCFVTSLI